MTGETAPTSAPHVYLDHAEPDIFAAMNAVAKEITAAAERAGVDMRLVELVNLRISQLNGCAYCLDVHHRRALKYGVDERKLAVLPAWAEADLFDEREQASLALAEAVTRLGDPSVRAAVEEDARDVLGDEAYAVVAWVAVAMNAFNRISIVSHHPVSAARASR